MREPRVPANGSGERQIWQFFSSVVNKRTLYFPYTVDGCRDSAGYASMRRSANFYAWTFLKQLTQAALCGESRLRKSPSHAGESHVGTGSTYQEAASDLQLHPQTHRNQGLPTRDPRYLRRVRHFFPQRRDVPPQGAPEERVYPPRREERHAEGTGSRNHHPRRVGWRLQPAPQGRGRGR